MDRMLTQRTYVSNVTLGLENVSIAGRIVALRSMKNYCFCDVLDMTGKIQVIIPSERNLNTPSLGDIVLAAGDAISAKSGQLSIDCRQMEVLSRGSPDVSNALKAKTAGANPLDKRSLDLMVDDKLKNMVKARSLFISIIRDHFRSEGFLEVDTPVMSFSRFAGTADVFETRSRTLEKNLYLRGTLEDYLKQLVVAGFEKVFQVGDCFRNESPALIQFTMLEATWAYAKSEQMLGLIQELISEICMRLPEEWVDPIAKEELSRTIEVVTFWGILEDYFEVDIRTLTLEEIEKLAKREGYAFHSSNQLEFELAKFGYDVIKRTLAKKFTVPTFVGRFPVSISPLAKEMQDGSGEADRGYGFFRGQRLFEVVEEASSYEEQLQKFQKQDERGHHRVQTFKHDDLLASLSYGCPPMAGLGFNVNRVLAVLLNTDKTSDVVPFPLTSAALPL